MTSDDERAAPPQALVHHLMTSDVVTLSVYDDLDITAFAMESARVRHLPVVRDGKLVGLITHRDLLRATTGLGLSKGQQALVRRQVRVEDVMTKAVVTVTPDTKAVDAGKLMRDRRIGCVLVVEDDDLVGILTEADFMDFALRALETLG